MLGKAVGEDAATVEADMLEELSDLIDATASTVSLQEQLDKIRIEERKTHEFNTGQGIWINRLMPLPVIAAGMYYQVNPALLTIAIGSLQIPLMLMIILAGQLLWQVLLAQRAKGFRLTRADFKLQALIARRRGQPFRSLEGYDEVTNTLRAEHMQALGHRVIGILAILFYLVTLVGALFVAQPAAWSEMLEVTLANPWPFLFAMSVSVGTGLSVLVWIAAIMDPTKDFDASTPTGLLSTYTPSGHPIFLSAPFSELISCIMEPAIAARWIEHNQQIGQLSFESTSEVEARERSLFLMHLNQQGVINERQMRSELAELYPSEVVEQMFIDEVFDKSLIHNLLKRANEHNPSFFRLIDRLEYKLLNQMKELRNSEMIFDCEVDRLTDTDSLNLMMIIANTGRAKSTFEIEISSPDMQPEFQTHKIHLNEEQLVRLPENDSLEITADGDDDLVHVMGQVLDFGVIIWLSLKPTRVGSFSTQVILKNSEGHILHGSTMVTEVSKSMAKFFAQHSKKAGMASGAFVPLMKAAPSLRKLLGLP